VARLMSHYWTADDPEATRQAQLEDWIEDLVEFSTEAIQAACTEWRRCSRVRPTPHDIRTLAAAAQARRAPAGDDWPWWLAEQWGPAPEGPQRRREFLRQCNVMEAP
jgi:hypothetical protein